MQFDVALLQSRLIGRKIGCRVHYRQTVDSTNRVAAVLAKEGAAEGTIVLADEQTAGRGRLQRPWQSPPASNLYLSIILRPTIRPQDTPQITLMAGVAVAEVIATFCPGRVWIKWPNDLLIGDRKVCGILTETVTVPQGIPSVIVGIGLNVNMEKGDFDPAHRKTATSLREETGWDHSRERILLSLCQRFEDWYDRFLRDGLAPVREKWLACTEMTGKRLRVSFRGEIREGIFSGIDSDGALLIAETGGNVERVTAGDATVLKEKQRF